MASAARQDKSEDEEENGEERRPFPLAGLEERRRWSQGYIRARRSLVRSAVVVKTEQKEGENAVNGGDSNGSGGAVQNMQDAFVSASEELDDGAEGNELTLVTLTVPELVARRYRTPGQRLEVCIDETRLRDYIKELRMRCEVTAEVAARTLAIKDVLLNGVGVSEDVVRECEFDEERNDEYSEAYRREVLNHQLEENGDPEFFERDLHESTKDLNVLQAILGDGNVALAPERLSLSSAPELYGTRQAMLATVEIAIPRNARGIGAALLALPLNTQVLLGDVDTQPNFDPLPIKTHHTVLLFAEGSGVGPVRSFVDSSWWTRRSASRGGAARGVRAHLFIGAETEDDLPFSDYYDVWAAGDLEVCTVCSRPTAKWSAALTAAAAIKQKVGGSEQSATMGDAQREMNSPQSNVSGVVGDLRDVLPGRGDLPAPAKQVSAILCGSASMTRDIKQQLLDLGVADGAILVWTEEDAWKTDALDTE